MLIGSNRLSGLRTTTVYDSYWRFAAERQEIYFKRLSGTQQPWTNDSILRRFKFTNAYRASDRVSQFLIRHVLYDSRYSSNPHEVLFRTLLFRLFNKEETWALLEKKLGLLTWSNYEYSHYNAVLTKAMEKGQRLYSAAYIIPPVRLDGADGVKHRGHLRLIEWVMRNHIAERICAASTLEKVFAILKDIPSFGNFLAFQLAIDLNYSTVLDHSEADFVVAGPGARDGIAKCFDNSENFDPAEIIDFVCDRQEIEFARLGLKFKSLWGRPLQLIDCQNLFCEISKYSRVAHPEIAGLSGRTRIKQIFAASASPLTAWYPPKWNLNDRIHQAFPSGQNLLDMEHKNGLL